MEESSSSTPVKSQAIGGLDFLKNSGLIWSTSVSGAAYKFRQSREVSAAEIAQFILKGHGEYADGQASSVNLGKSPTTLSGREWFERVASLFDTQALISYSVYSLKPLMHGRLFIIGLCIADVDLRRKVEKAGIFTTILSEIREPVDQLLTKEGLSLFNSGLSEASRSDLFDSVPTWPDDPVSQDKQDLLGRSAFARFLAARIAAIPRESCAYAIHIYGPWGAGKSTLLNFLHKELGGRTYPKRSGPIRGFIRRGFRISETRNRWLVVDFNAWLHQHIQPPWWSLMERVFKGTRGELNLWDRFTEYLWRFNSGRIHYYLIAIGITWLGALGVSYYLPSFLASNTSPTAETLGKAADAVSKIIALITTVWGGIFAVKRSLLFSSSQAAQTYTELTHDPTGEIKRRFTQLIKKLKPARVIIMIDDLDRCQSRYVIDLLEGIQTLFRDAPVVFVVAADRRWLDACYAEIYKDLNTQIYEPGKPLGTLFLEKAFRFATPLPGIPDKLKEKYWNHLLRVTASDETANVEAARGKATEILKNVETELGVRNALADNKKLPFAEHQALKEEAVVRLASPEIIERLEHTLLPYAKLLEPNPRSMKLLVNSYSANRALSILSEVNIELHQLALWTILCSRWPQLADHLAEWPDRLADIKSQNLTAFSEDLIAVVTDPDLSEIIKGDSERGPLTAETLKRSARMRL